MTDFKREGSHKKKSTPESWRKARGTHSRVRLEKKGAPSKPKAGYRTEKDRRGKHPSGFEEILVHNADELDRLDPETEAARIASGVGDRKRETMIEKASEKDIHVLNGGEDR